MDNKDQPVRVIIDRTGQKKEEDFHTKVIFHGGPDEGITHECQRAIRRIMESIEEHTNYDKLDPKTKKVVRGSVLDSVNQFRRIAMVYVKNAGK